MRRFVVAWSLTVTGLAGVAALTWFWTWRALGEAFRAAR